MQGQVRILQRNWEQAEAALNDTIAKARRQQDRYHEAVALLNLGTAHLFRDRFDHALQYFERILAYKELDEASSIRSPSRMPGSAITASATSIARLMHRNAR